MDKQDNRRQEERLRYHWPVWFGDSCGHAIAQGQMVDVSSVAAAFTCYTNACSPQPNEKITARFSVPQYGPDDSFELSSYTRTGNVSRVERVNDQMNRVVFQFMLPLDFKPGEQSKEETEEQPLACSTT